MEETFLFSILEEIIVKIPFLFRIKNVSLRERADEWSILERRTADKIWKKHSSSCLFNNHQRSGDLEDTAGGFRLRNRDLVEAFTMYDIDIVASVEKFMPGIKSILQSLSL